MKKILIEWKERMTIARLIIEVEEIVILVSYAWDKPFARVDTKKAAIAERG